MWSIASTNLSTVVRPNGRRIVYVSTATCRRSHAESTPSRAGLLDGLPGCRNRPLMPRSGRCGCRYTTLGAGQIDARTRHLHDGRTCRVSSITTTERPAYPAHSVQIDVCLAPGCFHVHTSTLSAPQCKHLPTLIDGGSDQKRTPVSSPLVPIFSTALRTSSARRTCGSCRSGYWSRRTLDRRDRRDRQTGLRPVHAVPAAGEGRERRHRQDPCLLRRWAARGAQPRRRSWFPPGLGVLRSRTCPQGT